MSPNSTKASRLRKVFNNTDSKNIMIPTMPSSAVIEKIDDSIEISTEYDLNATNDPGSTNLEELFKTPVTTRFVERLTESAQDEENAVEGKITLQGEHNETAEEAFDKLIGQESQIQTPTPDILTDLPKTDVEEWIENLDRAEPVSMTECEDIEEVEANDELATSVDAEISGINLLDKTLESVQNEPTMLDEPLFVEEPSMFDEPLIVSDTETEAERTPNISTNPKIPKTMVIICLKLCW
ncbi:hypothetical protein EVAR_67967_1 [Eumeta japonica]|uniref:Uncharacterized protein n=1 Tax=Eumeta variegata TaxID=151549 RepID=A0A4C2A224_EUMVA|nr:hypothetical protein EVAR_67967_1 [Eumeta japonica]